MLAPMPRDLTLTTQRKPSMGPCVLRLLTYLLLLATAAMVVKVFSEGSRALLMPEFPFVNVEFLTSHPQTLHVFTWEGRLHELSEERFQAFLAEQGLMMTDLDVASYPYSGGGIFPALIGTLLLAWIGITGALLVGVPAAIYLSEFAGEGRLIRIIRAAVVTLAGLPSIVYGLFGMGLFVFAFGWGASLLSGGLTLALLALPLVIVSSEAALDRIPMRFREAALALGSTPWQGIRHHVLPYALPDMLASSLLVLARVAGETAPILFTGALVLRGSLPWEVESPQEFFMQGVMALPYHIYVVSAKLPHNAHTEAMQYGAALVMLLLVLCFVGIAYAVRQAVVARRAW